jgi:predicted nucleic-acid-binding protein
MQWVFLKFYKLSRQQLVFSIESLIKMNIFRIENLPTFVNCLEIYKDYTLDLEDCYFIQTALQNKYIFTSFDKQAQKVFEKLKIG